MSDDWEQEREDSILASDLEDGPFGDTFDDLPLSHGFKNGELNWDDDTPGQEEPRSQKSQICEVVGCKNLLHRLHPGPKCKDHIQVNICEGGSGVFSKRNILRKDTNMERLLLEMATMDYPSDETIRRTSLYRDGESYQDEEISDSEKAMELMNRHGKLIKQCACGLNMTIEETQCGLCESKERLEKKKPKCKECGSYHMDLKENRYLCTHCHQLALSNIGRCEEADKKSYHQRTFPNCNGNNEGKDYCPNLPESDFGYCNCNADPLNLTVFKKENFMKTLIARLNGLTKAEEKLVDLRQDESEEKRLSFDLAATLTKAISKDGRTLGKDALVSGLRINEDTGMIDVKLKMGEVRREDGSAIIGGALLDLAASSGDNVEEE